MMSNATSHPETLDFKRRAWLLAHKLIALSRTVPREEQVHFLEVTTQALCNAMGKPEGARLEEVQAFTREVVAFMSGYGTYVSCGCGYLSLRVTDERTAQTFLEDTLEPTSFRPQDLEALFVERVLLASRTPVAAAQTCDPSEIRATLHEV